MAFKILKLVFISLVVTLVVAVLLVVSQRPGTVAGSGGSGRAQPDTAASDPAPLQSIAMRDGYALSVRTYGGADAVPMLVLMHGPGADGAQFDSLANALSSDADVIVPELRGDVAYIGQLEDDLADMIAAMARPDQPVIMAGHSMGGGLVVRFAGGPHGALLDGAILLAPFLSDAAPTLRNGAGSWGAPLSRRMLGLDILNVLRITALNHLQVVRVNAAQPAYSYRMNRSITPRRDYLRDVAALPPFVLIAGSADDVFVSSQFAPTMGPVTDKGRFDMLLGGTHAGIVDDPRTLGIIKGFLDGY
jgi:pimeloyl-ACP methyl ester carboxylesterase